MISRKIIDYMLRINSYVLSLLRNLGITPTDNIMLSGFVILRDSLGHRCMKKALVVSMFILGNCFGTISD